MNEERIKELFSNEEYVKGLFELGSYEAASAKLKEDDVDISAADLRKGVELLKKKNSGELSDEELESVAGGCEFIFFMSMIVGGMVVAGTTLGLGMGLTNAC